MESGVKVKATGIEQVAFEPVTGMRRIVATDPYALMAGTGLPSQRAQRSFGVADFELIKDVAGEYAEYVFFNNAARFYRCGHLLATHWTHCLATSLCGAPFRCVTWGFVVCWGCAYIYPSRREVAGRLTGGRCLNNVCSAGLTLVELVG